VTSPLTPLLARPQELGEDFLRGAAFFRALQRHLERPISLDEAKATLRCRFERRERDFLDLAQRSVYTHRTSPYRQLLAHAGCEYGDLDRLVRHEGLEGALQVLYRAGVYITTSELKSKGTVERGSTRVTVNLRRLRTPRWRVPAPITTGSRSRRRGVIALYQAMLADLAVNAGLTLDARGGTRWVHALWGKTDPSWALWLVRHSGPGYRPVRWFSLDKSPSTHFRLQQRCVARLVPWISRRAGAPLPGPRHVPFENPLPIIEWMRQELRGGSTPHLITTVSWAVHLCRIAMKAGYDLQGAQFSTGGEPLTSARLLTVKRTGATALPTYGSVESGQIAYGCLDPSLSDDLHLQHDVQAVIRPGSEARASGLPPDALLISSLRQSWPIVLLNVSVGDRADIRERRCGCPLERLGWTTHLNTVRSFEKLKVGGVPFLESHLIRLLEEVLPQRFGGGPTDYQLLETDEEVVAGQPRLRLLIHPAVGHLDADAVTQTVLRALEEVGVPVDRLWRQPSWFTVERCAPLVTAHGKIQHVHRFTSHRGYQAPASE
jgi:hypothetical protein